MGAAERPARDEFALLEVRGDVVAADRFDALAIEDGLVEARGLEPGDYELHLKRAGEAVRVGEGRGWCYSTSWMSPRTPGGMQTVRMASGPRARCLTPRGM